MTLHTSADAPITCAYWDELVDEDGFLALGRNRYHCMYVCYTDSTYYYAENGTTGNLDYGGPNNNGGANGTSCSAVIQAALDAVEAAGGGTVALRRAPTRYDVDAKLLLGSSTLLVGEGFPSYTANRGTYLRLADGVNDDMIGNKVGASDVAIMFLSLQGNRGNQTAGNIINLDSNRSFVVYNMFNGAFDNSIVISGGANFVFRNRSQNSTGNFIYVDWADNMIAFNEGTADAEVLLCEGANNRIVGNTFFSGTHGIYLGFAGDKSTVAFNRTNDNDESGITCSGTDCVISSNRSYNNTDYGIRQTVADGTIVGNLCEDCGEGIVLTTGAHGVMVTGNVCIENYTHGIRITDVENSTITGNECRNNGQTGNGDGIHLDYVATSLQHNVISSNICADDQAPATQRDGIHLEDGASYNLIVDNMCQGNSQYGIQVAGANCVSNTIKQNKLPENTTAPITDLGTDTKLETKSFPFIKEISTAAWLTTSPVGIEIDSAGEGALTKGWVPHEAQMVVRFRIAGVGLAAPGAGNGMTLNIAINSGKPTGSEAYNAEAIAVANKVTTEDNFAINDVIEWIIDANDDVDVDDIENGEHFECIALYNVAAGADIATDAVLGTVTVEFV